MSPKALILIVEGTEEIEFTVTTDILRRAEVDVRVAGLEGDACVKCSRGVKVCPDIAYNEAIKEEYDIVILPGGPGHMKFCNSKEVGKLLQDQEKKNKWIAAICAAPRALKIHGIGKGKTVTSYPSVKDDIVKDGEYKYIENSTVVDGKIITSRGPGTTYEFALTIVENLVGKAAREKVAKALLCA